MYDETAILVYAMLNISEIEVISSAEIEGWTKHSMEIR